MIVTLLKPFGSMLKLKNVDIYDNVFKMHTKLTVFILSVFSILASANEYFGRPIHCLIDDYLIQAYVESYCWVHGTFTIHNVTKMVNGNKTLEKVIEHQRYYQWIIVLLILQAFVFYIPAYLWKGWERGRIMQLCDGVASPVLKKDYLEQKTRIINYLKTNNSREHAFYVLRYIECEIMNFLIVIINMIFLNYTFNQFWIRYLPAITAIFKPEGETFSSLADDVFPILAKCTYNNTGPSGSVQIRDALCLLSMNVLNEKIFAFLYLWLIALLIVSGCNLIFRSIVLVSSNLRLKLLRTLAISAVPLTKNQFELILGGDNIGDWFFIFQLGRNLNPIIFKEILFEVANEKKILLNNDNVNDIQRDGVAEV